MSEHQAHRVVVLRLEERAIEVHRSVRGLPQSHRGRIAAERAVGSRLDLRVAELLASEQTLDASSFQIGEAVVDDREADAVEELREAGIPLDDDRDLPRRDVDDFGIEPDASNELRRARRGPKPGHRRRTSSARERKRQRPEILFALPREAREVAPQDRHRRAFEENGRHDVEIGPLLRLAGLLVERLGREREAEAASGARDADAEEVVALRIGVHQGDEHAVRARAVGVRDAALHAERPSHCVRSLHRIQRHRVSPVSKERVEAAAESLTLAIEDWPIAEAVLALLAERREWKKLARAYRVLLRLSSTSKAAEIGGVPREAREASFWRGLADVCRDHLHDDASALEALQMAWRTTRNPADKLAIAELHERARRFDDALAALEELVAVAPSEANAYERSFEIHAHRGDVDRAWCAAAALVMLGSASGAVRGFYEDHALRGLPALRGALDEDDWKKLRDPDDDPMVGEILRCAAPEALAAEAKLALGDDDDGWASEAFGVAGAKSSLGAGVPLDGALAERLYRSARAAARRRASEYTVVDLPVAKLKAAFIAAARLCGMREVPVPAGAHVDVAVATELLSRVLSAEQKRQLGIRMRIFVEKAGAADLARWRRGASKTLLRAGLLVANDPRRLDLLRERDEVLGDTRLAVAAAFTASAAYAALRARLGIAHAAPNAAPSPAPQAERVDRPSEQRARVALTWIAARPDAALFAIADEEGRLDVWAPREDRIVARQRLPTRIWRAEWTHDGGALLAVAAGSEDLHVFSSDGATRVATIATHHGEVTSLAVHPSRAWAATTGSDGRVRVWDLATRAVVRELDGGAAGSVVAMSKAHVAVGTKTGEFVVWELETGKDVAGGGVFGSSYVAAMAFDPAGKWLVMGGGQGKLATISTSSWDATTVWKDTPPKPIATNAIHFASDGRFVAAHSDDTVSLFASSNDEHPRRLGYPFWLDRKPWKREYIVSGACFVPNTKLVVSSHFDGHIRVWRGEPIMLRDGEVSFGDDDSPAIAGVTDRVAWWRDRGPSAVSPKPDGVRRKCASCGEDVFLPVPPLFARSPAIDDAESGLDGRPHFTGAQSLADDAAIMWRESRLETCPSCKHVAPRLDVAFPRIALAKEAREELFALAAHHEIARTYLYVAQLYGDEDPRREGFWVLRAAWADEAHGKDAVARGLRHRAGLLLEDALYQGVALSRARCGSSLVLAEIFRVSGDFERAAEHCWRGISIRPKWTDEARALVVEGTYILDRKTDALTLARACDDFAKQKEQREDIRAVLERLKRPLPPIVLQPQRRFRIEPTEGFPLEDDLADVFVQDFLDADLLSKIVSTRAVWPGIVAHPELLPVVLEACARDNGVIDELAGKRLEGFDRAHLRESAVDALASCLADDDAVRVRKVAGICLQIVLLDESWGPQIARAAAAAVGKWSSDLSTEGALERLIAYGPPEPGVIGGVNQRARTLAEMRFAASLRPCAKCGAPAEELALSGTGRRFTLAGRCRFCGTERKHVFYTYADPAKSQCPPHELGEGRSEIVTADELRAELERMRPRVEDSDARERALTCVLELLKLGRDDALAAERDRLLGTTKAPSVDRIWRARDRLLVESTAKYSVLDPSGEVERRYAPHQVSDEDDLWTYEYAVVGDSFVERATVRHFASTRTDEERILEELRAAEDDATRAFVVAALARAKERRSDHERVKAIDGALETFGLGEAFSLAQAALIGRVREYGDHVAEALLRTLVAIGRRKPGPAIVAAYARGSLLACFARGAPELVDGPPEDIGSLAVEIAARARDLAERAAEYQRAGATVAAEAYARAAEAIARAAAVRAPT
ncbi:MAG TPA: hypothetical protein VIF62_08050 [Labilithrix sp.]